MTRLRWNTPTTIAGLACGLALAAMAAVTPLTAAEMTPDERTAIEGVVRDYLLQHPEVLQEALIELDKRQQEAQRKAQAVAVKSEADALFNAPQNVVVGNPKGDITLVEFFDYNCGYCKRALGDLTSLVKDDPQLRVVLKDFPILSAESVEASVIALAAKQQLPADKFFEYHQRLLGSKGTVGKARAIAVAKEMGLDTARLEKDAADPSIRATLQQTMALGDKLSLTGTPAFILGSDIIPGAVGLEPLKKAVQSVRQCGRVTC